MKWPGFLAALLLWAGLAQAGLPDDWRYFQQVEVAQPGLVKLSLPPDTINAGRPGLEDLRLLDPSGREAPYLLERPGRAEKIERRVRKFSLSLTPQATIINLVTGLTQPITGITLETSAPRFIKAVQIEGSANQQDWQVIATGQPVFRQPGGPAELHLKTPPAVWPFLRLTVDDQRAEPVTFTGAAIQVAARPAPAEPLPAAILSRQENERQTRLTLDLGAAHLTLAAVSLETPEPLFMRRVTAAIRGVAENEVGEFPLSSGAIYRVAVAGAQAASRLTLPLEAQVNSRELLLLIDNQDNPPLQITSVVFLRRPVYVIFHVPQPGVYTFLVGNPRGPAPRYDLTPLASSLQEAMVSPLTLTPLAANPAFRPTEALPEIQDLGTALDLKEFKYRKLVRLTEAGVTRLDLDLETMAGADSRYSDLRLVREGQQRPYLLERTSLTGKLTPEVKAFLDPQKPRLSRWHLKLPHARLPLSVLTCTAGAPLFKREVFLYEEPSNPRGEKYHRPLARATWVRRTADAPNPLEMKLYQTPLTDLLILETDNGDNPPIKLENFQLSYRVTRMLFKAPLTPETYLYYGHPQMGFPRYDLELMAAQLLVTPKTVAALGPQERVQPAGWGGLADMSRTGSVLFWAALGLVVAVLLIVVARLLPKKSDNPAG
jgi:hypothetical protein